MAYMETSNLDGETNLKVRQSPVATSHLIDVTSLPSFAFGLFDRPAGARTMMEYPPLYRLSQGRSSLSARVSDGIWSRAYNLQTFYT